MLIPLQRKRKMKLFNFSKILKTRRKCHPQGHNGKNISAENARNPLLLVIRAQFGQHNNLTGKKSELWNVQYIYNISTSTPSCTDMYICTLIHWNFLSAQCKKPRCNFAPYFNDIPQRDYQNQEYDEGRIPIFA